MADEPWTVADLALLDEAEAAIAGPPRVYGHIVVDEAQDLSTMGLRALARRSRDASMTVLGDLAQATAPAAQESWEAAIAALGGPPTARRADLDLGYRVPASIMDVANGLLAEAAPDVTPCRSVRTGGRPPAVGGGRRRRALAAAAAAAWRRWRPATHRWRWCRRRRREVLDGPGRPRGDRASPEATASPVTTLDPPDAKGLEFDAVVVVEPAAIAGGTARGLRLLYVALTRAVQELVVVHALPACRPGSSRAPAAVTAAPRVSPAPRADACCLGRRGRALGIVVVGQGDVARSAQRLGHGLGEHVLQQEQVAGHVVGGRQLLGVALEVHELLAHQHQLAGGPGAVLPLQLDLLAQQLGQADLADGQVEHGVEHRPSAGPPPRRPARRRARGCRCPATTGRSGCSRRRSSPCTGRPARRRGGRAAARP